MLWTYKERFAMNGNKLFLDSNIILYLLNGDETLAELLNGRQLYLCNYGIGVIGLQRHYDQRRKGH